VSRVTAGGHEVERWGSTDPLEIAKAHIGKLDVGNSTYGLLLDLLA
jgi:hypothetical protein